MRIAIDARLNAYRRGGISEYTRQLLSALAPMASQSELITLQHHSHLRPLVVAPNVRRVTALTPPHHRLERYTLPVELLRLGLDVLHCPDFIAPRLRCCRTVVTIHDLAFLLFPDILDANAHAYYSQVRDSIWRADAVIAVSEATRNDISRLLDLPPERIDIIYEAAAPIYRPIELAPDSVRLINDQPVRAGTFLLFVSTIEPRKNLPTLLQALRICKDRRPERPYFLVIAGPRGWRDEGVFAAVRDLQLGDALAFVGAVSSEDLLWLYNACRIYANPSLYEGFGLPVLEALACGAPGLVAATSSLPEVAGEAAVLLPPTNAQQWADEIERLWDDEDRRRDLSQRGPAQAARFSWQRAASQTLAVYQRVAG